MILAGADRLPHMPCCEACYGTCCKICWHPLLYLLPDCCSMQARDLLGSVPTARAALLGT
jgi:hypothetical protein